MNTLRLEERPDVETRCPYCLDTLAAPTRTCAHCGTTLHAACRTDLARCPTQGCAAAVVGAPPPLPPRRATALEPALDRGLDELARRVSANRPAPRQGLVEVGKWVLALVLSVPLVLWLVKIALGGHAFFVAQGFDTRSASRLGGWVAFAVLFALILVVRWLWPEGVDPKERRPESLP